MQKHSFRVSITFLAIVFSTLGAGFAQSIIKSVAVSSSNESNLSYSTIDGVVEAVRQANIASQVPALVLSIPVKAGDFVRAGQILIQLDGRSASEGVTASNAQLSAALANLNVATKDLERKKQLFEKQYLSQSALEKAVAQFDSAQAQVTAMSAQAGVAKNQSNFFVITAPYDGVVSDVFTNQGDMAIPGKVLLNLYDPKNLRIKAIVAQSSKNALATNAYIEYEITDVPKSLGFQQAKSIQWLPNLDPVSHSLELRIPLLTNVTGVMPSMFAKIHLPIESKDDNRIYIPKSSVVIRSELVGVYVIKANSSPLLRQIKVGESKADMVEVLSGLSKGDLIATDPQAAAKAH
jgi:RND family efflux transporter MFP subunit